MATRRISQPVMQCQRNLEIGDELRFQYSSKSRWVQRPYYSDTRGPREVSVSLREIRKLARPSYVCHIRQFVTSSAVNLL